MPTGPDDHVTWEAWAHAVEKVGFLVWEGNRDRFSAEDLAAWDEAVREYLDEHRERGNGTE